MASLNLKFIGRYSTGVFDEGAAQISTYDPNSKRLFVVNADSQTVDVLDLSKPNKPKLVFTIDASSFGGGSATSVAVKDGILAIAIENSDTQADGSVVFYDVRKETPKVLKTVTVGALPDMLTFTPDGSKVLVANEGEPSSDYTVDPEGSVSIIDLSNGIKQATVTTADFRAFNDQRESLLSAGVRIFGPNATVAQDLEPEYIAVSPDSATAWVTLQEANALAVVDIDAGTVTKIVPLGYKDYSAPGNKLDASNEDGGINLQNWPVFGMYQPDAIASYKSGGKTYLVTANEGDTRDYDGFSEEERIADVILDPTAFPKAAELQAEANLGRLLITNTLGDTDGDGDFDELYSFGGRSFSIWNAKGNLVFDSGDDFEKRLAKLLPNDFNSNNDANQSFDSRSDDKGPEPEGVVLGSINGRTFAFIGLERVGGVMVYDITNPKAATFVDDVNPRDFSVVFNEDSEGNPDQTAEQLAAIGDLGPEGLTFIAAQDSPSGVPLLVTANEVSGTTSVFEINYKPQAFATNGDDQIEGTPKGDRIKGKGGDDTLLGVAGDDKLVGDEGNDILIGGKGDDVAKGSDGRDIFGIGDGDGVDLIRDFQDGKDTLGLLNGLSFGSLTLENDGKFALISADGKVLAELKGVDSNDLSRSDFTKLSI